MNLPYRHRMHRSRTCRKKRNLSKKSLLRSSKSRKIRNSILRGKSKKTANQNNSKLKLWKSKFQDPTPSKIISSKSSKLPRLNNRNSKKRSKSSKKALKRRQKNSINFPLMQVPTKKAIRRFKKRLKFWGQRINPTLTSTRASRKLLIKINTMSIRKLSR